MKNLLSISVLSTIFTACATPDFNLTENEQRSSAVLRSARIAGEAIRNERIGMRLLNSTNLGLRGSDSGKLTPTVSLNMLQLINPDNRAKEALAKLAEERESLSLENRTQRDEQAKIAKQAKAERLKWEQTKLELFHGLESHTRLLDVLTKQQYANQDMLNKGEISQMEYMLHFNKLRDAEDKTARLMDKKENHQKIKP